LGGINYYCHHNEKDSLFDENGNFDPGYDLGRGVWRRAAGGARLVRVPTYRAGGACEPLGSCDPNRDKDTACEHNGQRYYCDQDYENDDPFTGYALNTGTWRRGSSSAGRKAKKRAGTTCVPFGYCDPDRDTTCEYKDNQYYCSPQYDEEGYMYNTGKWKPVAPKSSGKAKKSSAKKTTKKSTKKTKSKSKSKSKAKRKP
jgi:hypothetical protein